MATAKEIKAAVRRQLAEQIRQRETTALAVADALAEIATVEARLATAREVAAAAVTSALEVMPLADLAEITGVDVRELRGLRTRTSRVGAVDGGDDTDTDPGVAQTSQGEPVGDASDLRAESTGLAQERVPA